MAQQVLTGGDGVSGQTGLETRNIINENFDEVKKKGAIKPPSFITVYLLKLLEALLLSHLMLLMLHLCNSPQDYHYR